MEWEVLIKQRIYWIEGQESIRISQRSQRIKGSSDHKLSKLCDKIKGCSDRNCRMSTFQGLQREMDRVGVGSTRVNFSLNPHHILYSEWLLILNELHNIISKLSFNVTRIMIQILLTPTTIPAHIYIECLESSRQCVKCFYAFVSFHPLNNLMT